MNKRKQIKIDESLFVNLCKYFKFGQIELHNDIAKGIDEKLDKILAHSYYTASLTEIDKSVREEARLAYLNHKGIPEDFRW